MREINRIVIHCAATRGDVTREQIDEWHKANGWSGFGYHGLIRTNGDYEVGRPFSRTGAHAKGYNAKSIGICLAGGYGGSKNYTARQWSTLELIVRGLKSQFPDAVICGHNDLTDAKACPNFDVGYWAAALDLV